MMGRRVPGLLLALLALPAAGQADPLPDLRLQLSAEASSLSNGLPPWQEQAARLHRTTAPRHFVEGALVRTRRFARADEQVEAGFGAPLSAALTLHAQASYSPTHRVVPRYTARGALQYEFAPAWLLHGALGHSRYQAAGVDKGSLGLEHYFGAMSAAVSGSAVRTLGTQTGVIDLRLAWYYQTDSSLGLAASSGREATVLSPGVLVLAPVRSVAIVGRHRLSPAMRLVYTASHTRQGGFYDRTGLGAGLEFDF